MCYGVSATLPTWQRILLDFVLINAKRLNNDKICINIGLPAEDMRRRSRSHHDRSRSRTLHSLAINCLFIIFILLLLFTLLMFCAFCCHVLSGEGGLWTLFTAQFSILIEVSDFGGQAQRKRNNYKSHWFWWVQQYYYSSSSAWDKHKFYAWLLWLCYYRLRLLLLLLLLLFWHLIGPHT